MTRSGWETRLRARKLPWAFATRTFIAIKLMRWAQSAAIWIAPWLASTDDEGRR